MLLAIREAHRHKNTNCSWFSLSSYLRSIMNARRENDDLKRLLASWKLEHLEQHFMAERITVEILHMMNLQHIALTMRGFPLGDQIRFEFNLEQWRFSIGRPLKTNGSTIVTYEKSEATTAMKPMTTGIPTNSVATQTTTVPSPIAKASSDLLCIAAEFPAPSAQIVQTALAAYALQESSGPPYQIDMRHILECCTPLGPQLLRDYARAKRLKKDQRAELINLLARYFTDNGIHLSLHMSYALEREILRLFPSERLEDYRTERRGKIYMRVCNLKHYKNKSKRLRNEESEKEEKEPEAEPQVPQVQLVRDSSAAEEPMSLTYSGEEDTLDSEQATPTLTNETVQMTSFQCDGFVVKQEFVDVGLGEENVF